MSNTIDWAALAVEFDPKDVSFRLQGNPRDNKTSAVVVAYVDSRAVQQRLDDVCGPNGWSFDWQPVVVNNSTVLAAKGTLTIAGVSKSDVGDAGQTEPTKASVSDALKRAAVLWGIGRYLYELPRMYAECVKSGNSWVMAKGEEDRLRRTLPRPRGKAPAATAQLTPRQPEAQAAQPRRPISAVIRETDAQRLNRDGQMDIVRMLRERGCDTPGKLKVLLAEALYHRPADKPFEAIKLLTGESDLTVGESAMVLSALNRLYPAQPAPAQANGKATRP